MNEMLYGLKGTILYSGGKDEIRVAEHGTVVCENGISRGIFPQLPDCYRDIPVYDYTDRLIIPGLTDLHVHAPQYSFRALDMDLELIEWLNTHTFPEEARYVEKEYAERAYEKFVKDLRKGATVNAAVFATLHADAAKILMEFLEEAKIRSLVGKVNMDRNSPDDLCENTGKALADTKRWICETREKYDYVSPILTPRFIPTCSDELLRGLGELQRKYHLPVQSHLSENRKEIAWVQELCPETSCYGEAYDRFGLFGGECPTIMAHCVHCTEEEIALLGKRRVTVAHCPQSNMNLASGMAPVRRYVEEGILVGLGSDVAGGTSLSIFRAMAEAVQVSKMRYACMDDRLKPLSVEEVFYMGTKGGGAFFGNVGSLEEGYRFDAVVLDDWNLRSVRRLTPKERLERIIYLGDDRNVLSKFVEGERLF